MQVITARVSELISIHAAREGGDDTPVDTPAEETISIHAAREGGDCIGHAYYYTIKDFNPRRP